MAAVRPSGHLLAHRQAFANPNATPGGAAAPTRRAGPNTPGKHWKCHMIAIVHRLFSFVAIVGLAAASGCAGASANVTADSARYPISMSPVVRDQSGMLLERQHIVKVGEFYASSSKVAVLYSLLPTGQFDISEEVNQQVAARGGEAIVNFSVRASDGCAVLNSFFLLNALPIWPGCVPITVSGDIIKRAEGPGAPTATTPASPAAASRL